MPQVTGGPPGKHEYRWDIQGMRAIAVLLVLFSHAAVPGFSGGYIGVDVFFVISGFLITGLLLADATKRHRVGFASFYSRRARRILPAATVVIVATSIASVLILNFIEARSVLVDGVWAAFFAVNVHFASQGTNYFTAATTATSPLQHYWSLSVEEQFYVAWPALLAVSAFGLAAFRRARRREPAVDHGTPSIARIVAVLVVIGAVSLYLSVHQTATNPHAAYFSTIDRAWELVVGALLAVLLPVVRTLPGAVRAALSWLGLLGIAIATVSYTGLTPMPGSAALLPVLSAAAVIAGGVGAPRGSAVPLLSTRPFRFFGGISYSLYLWHWPILILAAAYFPFPLNLAQRLGLLVLATGISVLSFTFIESPFQHAKRLSRRSTSGLYLWPAAVSLIVAVSVIAAPDVTFAAGNGPTVPGLPAAIGVSQGVRAGQAGKAIPNLTTPSVPDATSDYVFLGDCSAWKVKRSKICQLGDPGGTKSIVVFGNSHSVMWVPAVEALAKHAKWRFFPVVKEACGYDDYAGLRGLSPLNQCVLWRKWAEGVIRRLHPDVVVIGVYAYRQWAQGLTILVKQLKPLTRRLVIIGDAPGIAKVPGFCLAQPDASLNTCLWPESEPRIIAVGTARRIAIANHVGFVDSASWFCDRHLCPSVVNGLIPYSDNGHLTIAYSCYLAGDLGAKLRLSGESPKKAQSLLTVAFAPGSTGATGLPRFCLPST